MKKFEFSLDSVLDYKQQILDSLQVEHGIILAKINRQEAVLATVQKRYTETNEEYREKKQAGLTIAGLLSYQNGLHVLEEEMKREAKKLESLRQQETEKRTQLVASKIDSTSLEKLRDKKLLNYAQKLQKQEEQFMDEFVSSTRALSSQAAP